MPLQIIRNDITTMCVDAIVNPTNEKLVGYSGVDFAVHQKAGPRLDAACAKLVPLNLGCAKATKGYNLKAKYVIHTVGPVWRGGANQECEALRSCYRESLRLAVKKRCSSVAFPLISSGAYGFPKDQVLRLAVQAIGEFLFEHELMVYLCVFDSTSYEFSRQLFSEISAFLGDGDESLPDPILADCTCYESIGSTERLQLPTETPCEAPGMVAPGRAVQGKPTESLQEYMKQMDQPFAYKLFDWIDARGMTDVECYKKANVDKKTFSKIKCNPKTYRPSKQTAVAFAIALHLNEEETQALLASAGLTLSHSFPFDQIIRYFIQKEIYDIFVINEALFEFDQVLLGC